MIPAKSTTVVDRLTELASPWPYRVSLPAQRGHRNPALWRVSSDDAVQQLVEKEMAPEVGLEPAGNVKQRAWLRTVGNLTHSQSMIDNELISEVSFSGVAGASYASKK